MGIQVFPGLVKLLQQGVAAVIGIKKLLINSCSLLLFILMVAKGKEGKGVRSGIPGTAGALPLKLDVRMRWGLVVDGGVPISEKLL